MPVLDVYNEFRDKFPDATLKADEVHIREWDEVDPELAYSWFESLAKALNLEMAKGTPVSIYISVFEFMRNKYLSGDVDVKQCIDASFIENLFWQVQSQKAAPYWNSLPKILKELYVSFHGTKPA